MAFSVGGTPIGSPQKLEVHQQEQTATAMNAKQNQMLVKDTLEVPLTKMQGDIYKYTSSSNKPLMPMYVLAFLARAEKGEENLWLKEMKEMASKLPADMKYVLQKDLENPKELRDKDLESLKKSLEFGAKGLQWARSCKELKNKISEEERHKNEGKVVKASLDFYRQLLTATNEVAKELKSANMERAYFFQIALKIPQVLVRIGAKREKKRTSQEMSLDDAAIVKEIDELNHYLDKNLGERSPLLAGFLVSHLEVLHQLSYPGLNYRLFSTLWVHNQLISSEFSILHDVMQPFLTFAGSLNRLTPFAPFEKEGIVLIAELMGICVFLLDQNESKKEFAFYLNLHMLVVCEFFDAIGKELFQGLLIDEERAKWLQSILLAFSGMVVYLKCKTKKLEEKESSQIFNLLKGIFSIVCKATLEKTSEENLRVFCLKIASLLEADDEDEFSRECQKGLLSLGIKIEDLEKGVKGIKKLFQGIQEQFSDQEKERQKLTFSGRSA